MISVNLLLGFCSVALSKPDWDLVVCLDINQSSNCIEKKEVTYLLKTFFSNLERDVLALCFRSLRLGYFFFFPFPFLPTLSEPRFSPVAASMSRISSTSRQSEWQSKALINRDGNSTLGIILKELSYCVLSSETGKQKSQNQACLENLYWNLCEQLSIRWRLPNYQLIYGVTQRALESFCS